MKRTLALLILAATAASALSACVVVPADGYYYHPHYHPYYRRRSQQGPPRAQSGSQRAAPRPALRCCRAMRRLNEGSVTVIAPASWASPPIPFQATR